MYNFVAIKNYLLLLHNKELNIYDYTIMKNYVQLHSSKELNIITLELRITALGRVKTVQNAECFRRTSFNNNYRLLMRI